MAALDDRVRARLERLEIEARERPRRHAVRLIALIVLGYSYPLALFAVSFGIVGLTLAFAPQALQHTGVQEAILYTLLIVVELVGVALILQSFRVEFPAPAHHLLRSGEAPALQELVRESASRTGAAPVERIYISDAFNAGATQTPRHAFWGGSTSCLIIGIPLLQALTRSEFEAVLAHELGHLHGGHTRTSWWAYRVHATWNVLGSAFNGCKPLQRLVIGWFVEWYSACIEHNTLALRRIHEYEADQFSAQLSGPECTAASLCRVEFTGYRLNRQFWPNIFRLAGDDPIPPGNVFERMERFLATPGSHASVRRWITRTRRMLTPITSSHPSLADRLANLEAAHVLADAYTHIHSDPQRSHTDRAIDLLGSDYDRIAQSVTARWKLRVIDRWRMEHAYARHLTEQAPARMTACDDPAEIAWRKVEHAALFAPTDDAYAALKDFLAHHPDRADANLRMGQLLLEEDREEATEYLENAARANGESAVGALTLLLDYYRDLGRDAEASRIAGRLRDAERFDRRFDRSVAAVKASDAFSPHALSPNQLDGLRRILFSKARIRAAFLARRVSRAAPERTSHVLLIHCRRAALAANEHLVGALRSEIPLPCAVVIKGWSNRGIQAKIRRACPTPIFEAED